MALGPVHGRNRMMKVVVESADRSAVPEGRRLAGRRVGLLMAWVAACAFVLFQMSVAMTPVEARAMPVGADAPPCHAAMADTVSLGAAATIARPPGQDAAQPGKPDACPLMKAGGCFALCATILPAMPVLTPAGWTPLVLGFAETRGSPLAVPPLQEPPRPL